MRQLLSCLFLLVPCLLEAATPKTTPSGNQSDVQAAINNAAEGSTVTIPAGTFDWGAQLVINKAITLTGSGGGGTTIRNTNGNSPMIVATSGKNGHIQIANLNIVQVADNGNGRGFMIRANRDSSSRYTVIIHDCTFDQKGIYEYSVEFGTNGILCYNCTFVGTGANGIGGISLVGSMGDYDSYNQPSTLGTKDTDGLHNTYIEDCTFKNATNMANCDANSRSVWRHCTWDNAALGSHGQETSPQGVTSWEVYDCTFKTDQNNVANLNYWFQIRGGTGIITDNSVDEIPWGKTQFQLNVFSITRGGNDGHGGSFCPIEYPAPRQTGWAWANNGANWGKVKGQPSVLEGGQSPGYFLPDGKGAILDPVYVWNNTGAGTKVPGYVTTQTYSPDNCGNGQVIDTYLRKGRDYYVDSGPKPGYTKYPYPHPLRSGGPAPSPSPTSTPQPTSTPTPPLPTPTPLPTASPTVTPSPTASPTSYSQWYDSLAEWLKTHPPIPNK